MQFPPSRLLPWALTLLSPTTFAQSTHVTNFSEWFTVTEFPDAQAANLSRWQAEAQRVAGADLWAHYQHRCIDSQKYPEISDAGQTDGYVDPARPFDSLFFVGASSVSSWAIDTGEGLILIDTMWDAQQAEKIIVPGLEAFGYSGEDLKAVVITHEHLDHYGGATYLQETFGVPVYCSELCWQGIEEEGDGPSRNETVEDGGQLTVGNTTISVYATPGHTPGTISFLIPVQDKGEPHLVGFYGGGGIPSEAEDKATQVESFHKFAGVAEEHGADVLLSNHQTQDHTLANLDVLANRICEGNDCSLSNPYVVGTETYVRYLKAMALCVRVSAARENQNLRV